MKQEMKNGRKMEKGRKRTGHRIEWASGEKAGLTNVEEGGGIKTARKYEKGDKEEVRRKTEAWKQR